MSYPLVELGSIANFINGYAFKPTHWEDSGKPIIRIQNLTDPSKPYNYSSIKIADKYLVEKGDLLVSWSATLDVFEWDSEDALLNQHIFKVEPDFIKVDKNYLRYALKEAITSMMKFTRGSTMKHVNRGDFLGTKIPLPPLGVQKQIAAVLEKADTLRNQCQQMEQELNALAQSVFLDMFGDPVKNEMAWKKRKLKDLVADFQGGKSIAASENEENSGIHRVLKISAVTWGNFCPSESKPLPNEYIPPQEHFVKVNDLLFSRANTTELVGATSLVFETPENLLLPDKLWRFLWKDEEAQSQVFIWQLLSNPSVRKELGKISTGSGGSMKNISKSKLYDFEIIYPDVTVQYDYESKYKVIRKEWLNSLKLKQELDDNFDSLMQRAFKGELKLEGMA